MRRTAAVIAGLAVCGVAVSDDGREATLTLDPTASYTFDADLDDGGEYAVGRIGLGVTYALPLWERSQLSFELSTERSEYDFSGAAGLAPGGEPIEGATTYSFGTELYHPFDNTFAFVGGLSIRFAAEDGADFGESAILSGYGGARWNVNSDLSLTLAIAVIDRLEDDARVLPFIGVEWKLAENLRLSSTELGNVLSDSAGTGVGLVYESSDDLAFVVGASFSAREFRLDETGPVPNGVLRDDRAVVGLGVSWKPSSTITAQLGVGAAVWSNIEILNAAGDTIGDENTDPAMFITARVRVLF